MPLINYNNQHFPDWCEVEFYRIMQMEEGGSTRRVLDSGKEMVFVCEGEITVQNENDTIKYCEGNTFELSKSKEVYEIISATSSLIIIIGGHWSEPLGSNGIFTLENSENPQNFGDPVSYEHKTDLDNHFHDCDEYWIIYNGSCKVLSEGRTYEASAGDCVATKMGEHHTIYDVSEKIHGIYFETTLKGKRRTGHLWNHTHN